MAHGLLTGVLFLLALLLPGQGRAGEAVPVVNVGVFTVAPFIVAGPGENPQGILVDFFDWEIAPRMGVKFRWFPPVTVARLEQSLIRGTVTFTPILSRTPIRDNAKLQFSANNYIHFEPCIAVLPDFKLNTLRSNADISGMSIGWVQSGALPPFLNQANIKLDLVSAVDWERVNLDKLRLGRIQGAFFSDVYTPRYFANQNGAKIKLLKVPTAGVSLYGTFSPDAPASLIKAYDRAAREAFADGRWEAYLAKALAGK